MDVVRVETGSLRANCYIVVAEQRRAFVIDPGDDVDLVRAAIKKHKATPIFIVNTHGHIDHIKANAALKLPVYVHEADGALVSDPRKNLMTTFYGGFDPVKPERLLKDGDRIALDELSFEVLHTPGHTQGCACFFGHGVLFSGDTLFREGIGRTDFPGSSPKDIEVSLRRLSRLPAATVVYPGHGPKTTIGREFNK
jgi:hydroxyacylglutathione hydrolase